jgi:hypothetical protein
MGFINAIKNLFTRGRVKEFQRPIALEASPFGKLPVEILLQIRDYLPVSSASIFSICCMQMNQLIGISLLNNRQDMLAVGDLLARDLPDKVACSICLKLHDIKNANKYMASYYPERISEPAACVRACWRSSLTTEPSVYMIGEHFSAIAFKMAIKRYHQNPEDTQLLKLMSPKTEIRPRMRYRRLSKTDCLIVQGSLMHRVHSVFVSPEPSKWSKTFRFDPICRICPHLETRQSEAGIHIIERFDPANYHDALLWEMNWDFEQNSEGINASTGLRSCDSCKTEFRIDFKHYPRLGLAMFFTRWKDLGAGPEGDDYTRHIKRDYPFPAVLGFGAGEIAATFAGGLEFEFDAIMTVENEELLFNAQKLAN